MAPPCMGVRYSATQTKYAYIDGILQLICTDSSDYDDTNNIYIGRRQSNGSEF